MVAAGRQIPITQLDLDALDLVQAHLVVAATIELRRAGAGVVRHGGGLLQRAAVPGIGRDPRRPETVVADLDDDAGRRRASMA